MTDHATTRVSLSRRGLLLGSAVAALGVTAGAAACTPSAPPPEPDGSPNPSPSTPRERLGAQVGAPVDVADVARWRTDVDTLADHGQTLIRTAIYSWMVAPAAERWDPEMGTFYRQQLQYARDRGLEINLVVPGAPDWAQAYAFDEYVGACTWFWTRMRESFGDQVAIWQAFNEADHAHYQRFTKATRNATYLGELAQLLEVARSTLGRDGVPLSTNLTGWPMDDAREQEWYLVLDAIGDSLDVIGIDLYPADNQQEVTALPGRMRRVAQRYRKPIFVAEIGLQTTPDSWTEVDQQRYVSAAIRQLRTVKLWGICLYELRDQAKPQDGFGILTASGARKRGFADVMRSLAPR